MSERIKSVKYALQGLILLLKEEVNARIHFVAAFCVIICGFVFQISVIEWISVVLLIGLVFALELINTAIENISDYVSPEWNFKIKKIKDFSAAAVLVVAIVSLVVAGIIFIPKIIELCQN